MTDTYKDFYKYDAIKVKNYLVNELNIPLYGKVSKAYVLEKVKEHNVQLNDSLKRDYFVNNEQKIRAYDKERYLKKKALKQQLNNEAQ